MVHRSRARGLMAKQVQKLFGGGGGGMPRGAGLGAKLLGAAALIGYGITQSMYTGQSQCRQHATYCTAARPCTLICVTSCENYP